MSQSEKLLKKIRDGIRNTTWDDLLLLMKHYGFKSRITTHGAMFIHEDLKGQILPHVSKPHGGDNKVKRKYVEQCLDAIDQLIKEED